MPIQDLQRVVRDRAGFGNLQDYYDFAGAFLKFVAEDITTRIVSPSTPNYIFYQYDASQNSRITRPLNTDLFIEDPDIFKRKVGAFHDILSVVRSTTGDRQVALRKRSLDLLDADRVVYTVQQSIGSVGDSFADANQSRKRIGMLFEQLVKLAIAEVGVSCESRTINIPIPGHADQRMSYQLDLVFSRGKAIMAKEDQFIADNEIVGSVKTTSKDRIDKVFLDKFLLSRLLGRDIRVVAIFLHDVQRTTKARGRESGKDLFAVNSTFKTGHFLGYTWALNRLDGVYYVDPRPVMARNADLAREIGTFSQFIGKDLWSL